MPGLVPGAVPFPGRIIIDSPRRAQPLSLPPQLLVAGRASPGELDDALAVARPVWHRHDGAEGQAMHGDVRV